MRIAIDIDSTLHHYWDLLSDAARRRFGIELPYEEQFDWGITRLRPEQLKCCIEETHCEATILAGRPYPGAVETVNAWAADGHFIHVTTHRDVAAHGATEQWLQAIGLRFDELYCSYDKVARCRELGIELLIDDSPDNLQGALEHGIAGATILHPWNEEVCETEDVVSAKDWAELAAKLAPLLSGQPRRVA
jgi:FMN phosphatase YigB (HAD superfamily)